MVEIKQTKINKIIKIIILIVCLILLINCFIWFLGIDLHKPEPIIETINGCETGQFKNYEDIKNDIYISSLCLGPVNNNWDPTENSQFILLNNKKVLIYNKSQAVLYDPDTKLFKNIINKENSSIKWNPLIEQEFIKINKQEYLISPDIKYNESSNSFSQWNDRKYKNFHEKGKFYSNQTKYIATIDNKYYLYRSLIKTDNKFKVIVWLEDPINLTRSKEGQFNTLLDIEHYKNITFTKIENITVNKLSNNNILIIINNQLEIYEPLTGEITSKGKLKINPNIFADSKIQSITLKNGKVFIANFQYSNENSNFEIFDPESGNSQIVTGFSNKSYSQFYYQGQSLFKMLLLSDGKVLFYGTKSGIFNPDNNSFIKIPQLLIGRNDSKIVLLKDQSILIYDGNSYKYLRTCPFYRAAELLTINSN